MRAQSAGRARRNPTGEGADRRATADERAEHVLRPGPFDPPSTRLVQRQMRVWGGWCLLVLGVALLLVGAFGANGASSVAGIVLYPLGLACLVRTPQTTKRR